MNVFVFSAGSCFVDKFAAPPRRRRRGQAGGFALVVTLLIVSLLAVVAVSYLTSMLNEGVTANAYTSQTRAAQATQAGVDAAEAILAQSFRDFPDSCTVWDTQQTPNATNVAANTVGGSYNEGTSLYLRAMDTGSGTANPLYTGPYNASDPTTAANYAQGNNPNNLACKTFRLPLISGVPGGYAQLVSAKTGTMPQMNLGETDPTKQNWTDLNIRRFGKSFANRNGDLQGIIGSPATWTSTVGPKPARAYWVNLTGSDQKITGRYAFWIDDESFHANSSLLGNAATRRDNSTRPPGVAANTYLSLQPSDLSLLGPLMQAGALAIPGYTMANASADSNAILSTRSGYPGGFFPDLLALNHLGTVAPASTPAATPTPGGGDFSTAMLDVLRYVTTNQSGTLNLTRHGTQRLNLNSVVPSPATASDPYAVASNDKIGTQVTQIVEALKFHLPYFGQRFYRLTTDAKTATLNDVTQVPGSPKTNPTTPSGQTDASEIYYYKVAANIRDYVDNDLQPTVIDEGGTVHPQGKPIVALNHEAASANEIWAQGKEAIPYLQEVVMRIRPTISPSFSPHDTAHDAMTHSFDLRYDYYLEFWNMSDRDIYASPAPSNGSSPNLHGASVLISNQGPWELTYDTRPGYTEYGSFLCDGQDPNALANGETETDLEIDLTNGVTTANGQAVTPGGVKFAAGSMTVITTDPNCARYSFVSPTGQTSPTKTAWTSFVNPYAINPSATYYCPNFIKGTNHWTGANTIPPYHRGIEQKFRNPYTYDYETEVSLINSYGYLDSVPYALAEHYYGTTWYSDTAVGYTDYGYGSSLVGNYTDGNLSDRGQSISPHISQLGDPRTNNEQLSFTAPYGPTSLGADQSHYFYGLNSEISLGFCNPSQKPDALSSTGYPWPDYMALPNGQYSTTTLLNPAMNAINAPMVVADGPLTSIGQLGDVFDPARLPGSPTPGVIAYSRGGGRTFKIGQRDDRYSSDPSGNASNNSVDGVPASNAWAAWRLADVFSIDDSVELPGRININGVLRDGGAALLAAFEGFIFQPATNSNDPVIHGDQHNSVASANLAKATLDTSSMNNGYSQLIIQMVARLQNTIPTDTSGTSVPSGPFFERGELGELGDTTRALFGMSDPLGTSQSSGTSTALVNGVDMYKTFDHSREELFRRSSELICTRGDTFTAYAVGQSILQTSATAPLKITGTQRLKVTFRLVPKDASGNPFGYTDSTNLPADLITGKRFLKPDHYNVQVLSVSSF